MPLSNLSTQLERLVSASRSWLRGLSPSAARKKRADWLERHATSRPSKNDTVAAWPPQAARVLTDAEAEALALARRAAPHALVLAQVPLWRFVRVSARQSYARWLTRVGYINADLLVCDSQGTVLAVIDVYREPMSERSQRRHERLRRVLRATGMPVLIWQQGRLPSLVKARAQLSSHGVDCSEEAAPSLPPQAGSSRPAPFFASTMAAPLGGLGGLGSSGGSAAKPSRARAHEAVPSDFHAMHTVPSTIL